MSPSTSYQLPDLLTLSRGFELRTNRHCRRVTTASERWLLDLRNAILNDSERATLRGTKAGLLAALCFPTCDASQLHLITDFLSLLLCSDARMLHARDALECGWVEASSSALDEHKGVSEESGLDCLAGNVLFRHLVPRLAGLASLAHPSWHARFSRSTHLFRAAQIQLVTDRSNGVIPDLEGYIELCRDVSGLKMVFDIIELAEGLKLTIGGGEDSERLRRLCQCAADIIAWSLDIVSYNLDQSLGNKHNLITIIMSQKSLSVQGAITFAYSLVKQSFEAFRATELSLLSLSTPVLPHNSSSFYSPWGWLSPTPTPPTASEWDEQTLNDVQMYIQGLKDCIVGSINWAYETDRYFGNKGEEVRTFGWMFLLPAKDTDEGEGVNT